MASVPNKIIAACKQLLRYSIVSALALSTDILTYTSLISSGIRAVLAGVVGYTIGMLVHFVLSCRYVFDATSVGKTQVRLFYEFAVSGATGLGLTASLIWIMTEVIHQGAVIAKGTAVGASFLAVFILRRSVVFAAPPL